MALNDSLAGRSYPPTTPYRVSREKIAEFADAIGDLNPVYRDPAVAGALGYPDVLAPPTFAIVLTLAASMRVLGDPDSGWDQSRVVHRDQSFSYLRPICAGDVLEVELHIDSVLQMAGNDVISTRADVRTADGEHVVDVISVLVVRAPDHPAGAPEVFA